MHVISLNYTWCSSLRVSRRSSISLWVCLIAAWFTWRLSVLRRKEAPAPRPPAASGFAPRGRGVEGTVQAVSGARTESPAGRPESDPARQGNVLTPQHRRPRSTGSHSRAWSSPIVRWKITSRLILCNSRVNCPKHRQRAESSVNQRAGWPLSRARPLRPIPTVGPASGSAEAARQRPKTCGGRGS